jgi:hypothetical protein
MSNFQKCRRNFAKGLSKNVFITIMQRIIKNCENPDSINILHILRKKRFRHFFCKYNNRHDTYKKCRILNMLNMYVKDVISNAAKKVIITFIYEPRNTILT